MKRYTVNYTLVIFAILATSARTTAQTQPLPWKKEVARVITLKENTGPNKPHTHKNTIHDSTLLEMIVAAGMNGKITLYSNIDHQFTTSLSAEQLKYKFYPPPDTTDVYDPVAQKEFRRIRPAYFDFDEVTKYRFLEKWTFDQRTGETDVHIVGVAPLRDVYLADGTIAVQAEFWVHYEDVAAIISRYERKHPANLLTQKLWTDYLSSIKIVDANASATILQTDISKRYDLDPEDTGGPLKTMDEDTSLYNYLYNSIVAGTLSAYDSAGNKLSMNELEGVPDTATIVDPISGTETRGVVPHPYLFGHRAKYRIAENWTFSKMTGNLSIKTTALVPYLEYTDPYDKTFKYWHIFWLRYNDVYPTLLQYQQRHPGISLELNLWKDRLYSNRK